MKIIAHNSLLFFPVVFFLYSCKGPGSPEKIDAAKKSPPSPIHYKKPPASFDDTLIILRISAVFYNPDSVQLGRIKKSMQKEQYETEVHNCYYLMRNARRVMAQYWRQIHIIETTRVRYLLFIKKDKSRTLIDLNSENDICGIFLFDRKKSPELADMMNIDTALGFYFKK